MLRLHATRGFLLPAPVRVDSRTYNYLPIQGLMGNAGQFNDSGVGTVAIEHATASDLPAEVGTDTP